MKPSEGPIRPAVRAGRRVGSLPVLSLFACLVAGFSPTSARANVYATNIKLHAPANPAPGLGVLTTTPAVLVPGSSLQIDYVLNEDATAGVTVEVLAGSNTVRQIVLPLGSSGTLRGTNSVLWDGTSDAGTNVPLGLYSLRITAASAGYAGWTQTSDDNNPGSYVFAPRGIAVDRNPNSPYYGRVFVANGQLGIDPTVPGNLLGVLKLNADGSPAEEGVFSDGGWAWAGNEFSPWKIAVSDDDDVYVSDLSSNGLVLRFDQTLSTNSQLLVLRPDNWPTNAGTTAALSGPFLTGAGTNTQLWMADTNRSGSVGIRRWAVATEGPLATNDLGSTIVAAGGGSDLDVAPFAVAVDLSNRIYTIQDVMDSGSPSYRVFRFPAYSSGPAERVADWKIGTADDSMRGAVGVAVDPTATYVAVAFRGAGSGVGRVGGAVQVFSAADGSLVTTQTPAPYHDQTDVAWDNAGNLYTCDNWDSVWRAFSPPGTNQATTVAVQPIVVGNANGRPTLAPIANQTVAAGTTLTITNTASDPDGDQLRFSLAAGAAAGASLNATNGLFTWTPTAAQAGASHFTVVVTDNGLPPLSATQSFTVTVTTVVSNQAPVLSAPVQTNNTIQFTLIGQPDATYVILASSNLVAWAPVLTNHEAAAVRLITLPAVAGQRYFRAELLQSGNPVTTSPVLSAPGWANGQVRFTLSGQPDAAYVILGSTNLVTWAPVATNQAPAAVRSITLPSTNRQNFFRAEVAP